MKFKYSIKIEYHTGDSFQNYDTEDTLELRWNNLDVAKENLQRIKEHYEQYREINYSYSAKGKKIQEILKANKDKPWFVHIPKLYCISQNNAIDKSQRHRFKDDDIEYRSDIRFAEYCLFLKTDEGNEMQISAFWCGYFESLNGAEIETNEDDTKISFR